MRARLMALGALWGGLKLVVSLWYSCKSNLKDYCWDDWCCEMQREPQQVAKGPYSMPPHNIIVPKHCPDVWEPPISILSDPIRPQEPLAQKDHFFTL